MNVRIGIATGLVVVGDLIGAGAAQERGVVGETPNLAARLQALALPGTLVVADADEAVSASRADWRCWLVLQAVRRGRGHWNVEQRWQSERSEFPFS